jgi:hypothetical protein
MGIASKRLYCAKQMPELKHKVGEGEFDIMKSEVVQWLVNQPEILQYIFNRMTDGGEKALIVYNSERDTWQGVDYGKD